VVESLLKIYESVGMPDLSSQRLTAHNFPGVFQQNLQNLKWLLLKLDPQALLAQFYGFDVCLEVPEADRIARRMSPICHATPKFAASLARVVSGAVLDGLCTGQKQDSRERLIQNPISGKHTSSCDGVSDSNRRCLSSTEKRRNSCTLGD